MAKMPITPEMKMVEKRVGGYVAFHETDGTVCLYGTFTVDELRLIEVSMRHSLFDSQYQNEPIEEVK